MKTGNYKEATFNAVSQLLAKLALEKLQASRINGERECKRRRQQMAYDAGLADRRALPR